MVAGMCGSENVVTNAQLLKKFDEAWMVVLINFFRILAQLISSDGNRSAV